jgi:CRP-like cAMP-binding protein
VATDEQPMRTLMAGDCFGEIALLHMVPRIATVTTTTETKLWALRRDDFLTKLGNLVAGDSSASRATVAGAGLLV